jgi:AcrR family transcriptional regulator
VKKATGPRSGSSTAFTRSDALPLLGEPAAERADAQRNRLKILDAAERLFAANGIANVSMDAVAKAAGVGKGTLFRRFGDRAGLAVALLDERERELQERILHGPAPLGPSASSRNRLLAFLSAYADFLEAHGDVVLQSETAVAGARYRVGVYHFWHRHVTVLLEQAAPRVDAEYQAHALLAPLAADLYHALRRSGVPAKRIKDGVRALAIALLDAQHGRARS